MLPLDNAEGRTPGQESALTSAPYSTNNAASHTTRRHGRRHAIPGQLPLVRAATVHEPYPGQKRAMVLPDDVCPRCGFKRLHWSDWPAPALLRKRCRCGCGYELTLYPMKAKRRSGRRAAA
ncbi:hypothetical protein ABZU32_20400 [Sphaerisporangium sp. NPDC005288]|uniref:hypothetical protein n=1 Tax=Sphaerisporangium sp. NPDC005288 TaxID=3155114 RepID=UPI0033A5BB0E